MTSAHQQSVAIIGIGCRFPGGVDSPESLWSLLSNEGDAIIDVPKDRWSTERFYSEDTTVPGKTIVRRAGFLQDPVQSVSTLCSSAISPREAQHMDPQQRLLLEVGWESMEDAGLIPADLAGSKTGVYVGGFALDAMTILMSPLGRKLLDTHHAATAASMTMLAARLSYVFDFRGPSVTMDTGLFVFAGRAALRLSGPPGWRMRHGARRRRQHHAIRRIPDHHEQGPLPGPRRSLQELRRQGRRLLARRGLRHRAVEAAR